MSGRYYLKTFWWQDIFKVWQRTLPPTGRFDGINRIILADIRESFLLAADRIEKYLETNRDPWREQYHAERLKAYNDSQHVRSGISPEE